MYFVRSGFIFLSTGSFRYAGYGGLFWNSTAYPADIQYSFFSSLYFGVIYLSETDGRDYGFSLCFDASSMYFVRSGYIILSRSTLYGAGYTGIFWSSTPQPATTQYTFHLYLALANTYPSTNNDRYYAFPLSPLIIHIIYNLYEQRMNNV